MAQQELLTSVLDELDKLSIPYVVTGSWASSLQGEPRSTHDVDLVIDLEAQQVPAFLAAFENPDYYLSSVAVNDAILHQTMFNLLDLRGGEKVDFWIRTAEPWDQERFNRRIATRLFGRDVWITTPEDTILAKLRWSKLSGGSEKQFTDALRVYEVQRQQLDTEYIAKWSVALELSELWQRLMLAANMEEL